jgi:hypothetical protein
MGTGQEGKKLLLKVNDEFAKILIVAFKYHQYIVYYNIYTVYDNCMNASNFLRGGGENHADDIFLWSQTG